MSHYRKKNPPKRRYLNETELEMLTNLAAIRVPQAQMCTFFKTKKGDPMSYQVFKDVLEYDNAARAAFDKGVAKSATRARDTLFRLATGTEEYDEQGRPTGNWTRQPDMSALRFWCETQEGFKRAETLNVNVNPRSSGSMSKAERDEEIARLMAARSATEDEE